MAFFSIFLSPLLSDTETVPTNPISIVAHWNKYAPNWHASTSCTKPDAFSAHPLSSTLYSHHGHRTRLLLWTAWPPSPPPRPANRICHKTNVAKRVSRIHRHASRV